MSWAVTKNDTTTRWSEIDIYDDKKSTTVANVLEFTWLLYYP